MITVFTPTYNRAYKLTALYNSLIAQYSQDFEWLIVDDGSQDNTRDLINSFIQDGIISIRYYYQSNGGKHIAINKGVTFAKGDLFFIVDSDDILCPDAIQILEEEYSVIKDNNDFAGICGLKADFRGMKIGGESNFKYLECSSLDFRYKYKIKGDMAEAFKLSVLKKYPFPEIKNEKFCPEATIWNRIALNHKLRYFYKKIYLCEYLSDGLTAKIVQIRMNSPHASMTFYSELSKMPIPLIQKIKALINFWRFSFCSNSAIGYKIGLTNLLSLPLYPIGLIFYYKDRMTLNSKK